MAEKKLCLVIRDLGATKTPERARAAWLSREIIEPVITANFPEFEIRRAPMILSPEDAESKILRDLYNADLVIADMINDDPTTMYQLGVRHMTKRPIVHITSSDGLVTGARMWRDWKSIRFIIANQDDDIRRTRENLKAEIDRALQEGIVESLPSAKLTRPNKRELAARVDKVAAAIAELRINSASEYVEQLNEISAEISRLPHSEDIPSVRDISARALRVLTHLFDALGTKRGAQVILAGAVGGIMSAGGWPAVTTYALTLAVWHGKHAFLAALDKAFPKGSEKKPAKRRKKS
jgi:hypothetical protein